ncbi:MAG: hypothetical protein WA705_07500 [Candidatus Ozemobacteraceae bacterium]
MNQRVWCLSAAFFLLVTGIFCDFAWAGPASSFSFSVGSGDGAFGVLTSPEGPEAGPVALIPSGNGLVVLDGVNSRLVRIDEEGKLKREIPLPMGNFKDLARTSDGTIWVADEKGRDVYQVAGGSVRKAFSVTTGDGFPRQFDALTAVGDDLAIGDFASLSLYRFSHDGKLLLIASWPVSLSVVADAKGNLCCLGFSEEDVYNRFIRIDAAGKMEETRIKGEGLTGARLLGFLPDGRGVGFGISNQEPFRRALFIIESNGTCSTIDTIDTPLLLATRSGAVEKNSVWVNASPISGGRVLFYRYEVK